MTLDNIRDVLNSGGLLAAWLVLVGASLVWVIYDLRTRNPHIASIMQWVWVLTVLYSGPIGALVYRYSGHKQIPQDTLPRQGFRSVAHCYSGCGIGEILGVVLTVGVFALGTAWSAIITFVLAYLFGFALNLGPMMQAGTPFWTALKAHLSPKPSASRSWNPSPSRQTYTWAATRPWGMPCSGCRSMCH